MAREHITVRLSADVLQGVESWAKSHDTSRSAAIDALCKVALNMRDEEERGETAGEVAAMQAHIETLTRQLEVKDAQIGTLTQLADQAQRLHAASTALPAASTTERGQDAEQGEAASQDGQERRKGWFERLFG